jgi:hypothetical protein
MKKCPQCSQVYGDDTNFCLSDGTTLVSAFGNTSPNVEIPTVINRSPFVPPITQSSVNNSGNSGLTYLLIGLLALIIGGGVVGTAVYFLTKSEEKGNSNAKISSENSKKDELSDEKVRLKEQQDKLDEEKKKLENERKDLENKKKQTPLPTVLPSVQNPNSRTAYIIDPPSNIRATPNGTIICVARTRGALINILGSTGVTDNNGTWYYTDYCGRQGVIHSTQIRF